MASESSKKIVIFLMLGLLTASAFFMRLENFKNSKMRSIDEVVYYRMAKQVLKYGSSGYHTMPYGKEMADSGRDLPDYFFKPLFKHPPVFTFLLSFSMRIFGKTLLSAEYVALLFGVLLIPLTFFIGKELFDSRIAMAAAMFMWIDPVSVITSQKVWMDTTMSFFMLLSLFFFIRGMNLKRGYYFLLGGLACGLAMLTKYTGILVLVTMISVAFVHRRELFFKKAFIFGLILPFMMLLPWAYWNYRVYGGEFLVLQQSFHHNRRLVPLLLLGVIIWTLFRIVRKLTERFSQDGETVLPETKGLTKKKVNIALGFFLMGGVAASIIYSLQLDHLPRTSWTSSTFKLELPVFYVGQLIEYSFIYFFAFAALFIDREDDLIGRVLLKYASVITLVFFTVWRSFQCRYILFVVPLLVILGFELIFTMFRKIDKIDRVFLRMALSNALVLLVLYAIARTLYIDVFLSFGNDMCYY